MTRKYLKQNHSTNPLMPPASDLFRANPSALEEETNADSNPFSPATEIKHEVDSVRVRLPPFWSANPATWFIQAEAQFTVYRITSSDTKYCLTVSALPPDTLDSVIDILNNPPSSQPYETLKGALIERHSLSEIKKLESLLDREDIGDRRPSEVFRSMRMLACSSFNESIIRNLWLRRLPRNIYITLLAVCDKPMNELTSLADKIYEASQSALLNAVSKTNNANICASSPVSGKLTDTSSNFENQFGIPVEIGPPLDNPCVGTTKNTGVTR
ncbi:uncharacterized protein LOC129616354 [Condylostylus longicornis]|uniref:uncharacterized protein LOC129616354 n=1 Tax=Condylostylus longicornis TaxID=2530218 RepID=UPI00244DB650|nr:uncharacterized protein LOC129616354 [Condylostylus longicornis]